MNSLKSPFGITWPLETYKAVELNLHQFQQHFRSLGRWSLIFVTIASRDPFEHGFSYLHDPWLAVKAADAQFIGKCFCACCSRAAPLHKSRDPRSGWLTIERVGFWRTWTGQTYDEDLPPFLSPSSRWGGIHKWDAFFSNQMDCLRGWS